MNKSRRKGLLIHLTVLAATIMMADATLANPVLDNVAAGQVTVQQTPTTTVVNQGSQKAIINWQSFNIGAGEKTHFEQPANGIALNRINPNQGASQIYGQLTATGKIILVNQAGIYFGPGSFVNVGGIIASTSDISDANFLAGKYSFDQPSAYRGSIINEGQIRAAQNGLVALIGTGVRNDGTIEAHTGSVVLASGNKFTVDLSGDGLVNFTVDEATPSAGVDRNGNQLKDAVSNNGVIKANGGTIIMTARTARGVVDNAINMRGVAQAHSVSQRGGTIILDGGDGNVRVAGRIDVSGKRRNAHGGTVKILARNVHLEQPTVIDASGYSGGGTVLIGGNYQGKGPEKNAYSTRVDKGVQINADALQNGNGGKVIVWADNDTSFNGSISARGGLEGGDGGFVETSGKHYLNVSGSSIDLRAPLGKTGTWLLDPENLTIQNAGPTTATFASDTYTSNVDDSILTVADLEAALGTASIVVQTGSGGSQAGDITVADPIYWNNSNSLTLSAYNNVIVNASITNTSTGNLTIQADTGVQNTGTIQINSGITLGGGTLTLSTAGFLSNGVTTGSAGTIDVNNFTLSQGNWVQSGPTIPSFAVANDFQLASGTTFTRDLGTTTIGGNPYQILTDIYGLQGFQGSNFVLNNDIDATVTRNWNGGEGFLPLAQLGSYGGLFDGQGHIINNLYINRPDAPFLGLFYSIGSGGLVSNVGLTNINYTGATLDPGSQRIGGIAGNMSGGTLNNVFVTGSITQGSTTGGNYAAGGLVGSILNYANDAVIENSYNAATINSSVPANIGGLVGLSDGATISNSYNSGTVTGTNFAGGLIGTLNGGTLSNSYNVGTVNTTNNNGGGLIGYVIGGTISNTYSSGIVSGPDGQGGLIGGNSASTTVTNSYWDTQTSGQSQASIDGAVTGVTGLTTNQALTQTSYSGWDFTNTWFIPNYGDTSSADNFYTRPILQSEYSTNIRNAHQLQLVTMDENATYTLVNDIDASGTTKPGDIWGTSLSSGSGFVPLGGGAGPFFNGTFNGNGYVIDSLYMNRSAFTNEIPNIALFGDTEAISLIENVGLTNINYIYSANNANMGAFVGFHGGELSNVYSTGTITGTGVAQEVGVGGLVGTNGGTILNSYSTVSVTGTATSGSATFNLGGLVGRTLGGSISQSYSTGAVTANTSGTFSGSVNKGGFIGLNLGGTFVNNYWDTTTSGQASSPGATGLTTAQLMDPTNFTGWNFNTNTAWGIITNKTMPFLQVINTGISGTSSVTNCSGCVGLTINGVDSGISALDTDNSGTFYTLARTVNIPAGTAILAYLNSVSTSNAVTSQANSGDVLFGLVLNPNTIYVGDAATKTISNSDLALAEGHSYVGNSNILYASAGSNVYLGNGSANVTFSNTVNTTYNINGTQTPSSGTTVTYSFDGPITLGADVTLTGTTTFNNTLDGAFNLTLASNTEFDGTVGQTTPLTSLTANGVVTVKGITLNTTGDQTYNADVLVPVSSTMNTTSGNIVFNGNITGVGNDLTLSGTGDNSFKLTNGLSLNNLTVNGGTGTNTLDLETNSATQIWTINAANGGTITLPSGITGTFAFSNMQNLTGGSGADSFVFGDGDSIGGALTAGAGVNHLDLSAYTTAVSVDLQAGTATGVGTTFSGINDFTGGTGSNTLAGTNGTHSWNITANDGGNIDSTTTFTNFGNLTGGTGNDSFIFSNGKTINGSLDGGTGTNSLDLSAYSTAVNVDLQAGTATGVGATFSNISIFTGGSGSNTFAGSNGTHSWNITANNGGNIDSTTTFTNFGSLTGGTGNDSFIFGNGKTISGSLDGGTGTNSLDLSAYTTAVNVDLQAGTATGVGTTFSNISSFTGGSGTNSLTGANGTHTWNITANNGGNIDSTTTFASFANLTGGTGNDSFVFGNGNSISGSLNGGTGTNSLDLSAYSTAVNVNLQAGTATGVGTTFSNISSFTGGSGSNTLTGPNGTQSWNINANNGGTVGTNSFTAFGNLVGGTGNDSFIFGNGNSISGSLNGGTGTNSLDLSAYSTTVNVDLQAGTATGIGSTFSNISSFTGGSGSNTLTGPNGTQSWNINANNGGTVGTNSFTAFGNLVGGTGNDSFIFGNGNSISGSLNGGTGTNSLDLSAYSTAVNVDLQAGTATGVGTTFSNISSFTGGSGSNTLTGPNGTQSWNINANNGGTVGTNSFTAFGNLVGGTGNDSFIFGNGKTISGSLDGGTGTNSLDLSAYSTAVNVDLQAGTATGVGTTFSNINSFTGGSGTNSLTGANGTHTWNITANNGGNIDSTTTFASFANLAGGTGNDSFVFGNGNSISGGLNGGTGTNSLDLSAYSTAVNVNLQAGTATGVGTTFSNISSFTGGSGSNTLTGPNGTQSWNINANNGGTVGTNSFTAFGNLVGGTGNDSFIFGNGKTISGSLDGGTGTNSLDLSAYSTAVNVDLQAGTATGVGTALSNISNFTGNISNSNANTLTATSSSSHNWNITANNSGSLDSSTTFSNFGTLVGGNGDTFALGDGLTLNSISATAGTLDESAYTSAIAVNGGTNSVTGVNSISGITTFIGGSASNTFTNTTGGNTWTISGSNIGSIAGKNFNVFGTVVGGAGDSFVLGISGAISGNLTGNNSTLDISALSGSTVNLASNTATGIGGTFSGINTFAGSGATSTLIGTSANTTWNINSTNGGTVSGNNFSGFGNLTGGTGTNTFVFTGNGGVGGVIDGGNTTNTNTLDFSGYSQQISLVLAIPTSGTEFNSGTLSNNSSVSIGAFTQIQQAIGSNTGLSTITLPNKSNITVTYTNPPTNTNGSIADPFLFTNMQILNAPTPTPTPTPTPEPTPAPAPIDTSTVISGTTADIVNQNNMNTIIDGVNNFADSFSTTYAVNVNIGDLIQAQDKLTTSIYSKTKFGCQ